MAGPLFENFCIQETVKAFYNSGERAPLYYVRTNNNLEVDDTPTPLTTDVSVVTLESYLRDIRK